MKSSRDLKDGVFWPKVTILPSLLSIDAVEF